MTVTPRPSRKIAREQRKEIKAAKSPVRTLLTARTPTQAEYLKALRTADQVFGIGPAGTGKTYIAPRWAIRQVIDGAKERVVIARPTVAKPKHRMGFLPGGAGEKQEPWLLPVLDAFADECGASTVEKMRRSGQIVFAAFEHMRGRTFRNATVVLDEGQNCDFTDLQLFLTRSGEDLQILVNGDLDQIDIPDSGLDRIIGMIGRHGVDAAVVRFDVDGVVRSGTAAQWVRAFRKEAA